MSRAVTRSLWLGFAVAFFGFDIVTGRIGFAVMWFVLAVVHAVLLGIEIESAPMGRTYTYDIQAGVLRVSGRRLTKAEADAIKEAFIRGAA